MLFRFKNKKKTINNLMMDPIYQTNFKYENNSETAKKYENISFNWDDKIQGEQEEAIPKIIHLIWIGSPIPSKYWESIHNCLKINPSYLIYLWIEDITLTDQQKNLLLSTNKVFLKNYREELD